MTDDTTAKTTEQDAELKIDTSTSWHSYPKIFAFGHKAINNIILDKHDIIVEEKVDGSQFSFGSFGGEVRCKSKRKEIILDAPDGMFKKAVEVVMSLDLKDGFTYRAEYLQKPKHNTLAYNRHPTNHLMIFDINDGHESYLSRKDKEAEAERLGLECVPLLFEGQVTDMNELFELMEQESVLGGPTIEGFVLKNYKLFIRDKVMMGKYVSDAFKEKNHKSFRKQNPNSTDVMLMLCDKFRSEARWNKAIQRVRDDGELLGEPKDIGRLVKEIQSDIIEECADEIKEALYKWAIPQINRRAIAGFPEFYKKLLAEGQPVDKNLEDESPESTEKE